MDMTAERMEKIEAASAKLLKFMAGAVDIMNPHDTELQVLDTITVVTVECARLIAAAVTATSVLVDKKEVLLLGVDMAHQFDHALFEFIKWQLEKKENADA